MVVWGALNRWERTVVEIWDCHAQEREYQSRHTRLDQSSADLVAFECFSELRRDFPNIFQAEKSGKRHKEQGPEYCQDCNDQCDGPSSKHPC